MTRKGYLNLALARFFLGDIMNTAQIRQLAAAALQGKTDAGDRIYLTEIWPVTTYPAILLQTPLEVKESIGRNAPQFNTITTLRINGHIQLNGTENQVKQPQRHLSVYVSKFSEHHSTHVDYWTDIAGKYLAS